MLQEPGTRLPVQLLQLNFVAFVVEDGPGWGLTNEAYRGIGPLWAVSTVWEWSSQPSDIKPFKNVNTIIEPGLAAKCPPPGAHLPGGTMIRAWYDMSLVRSMNSVCWPLPEGSCPTAIMQKHRKPGYLR